MANKKPQEINQPNPEVEEQESVPEFEQVTEHPDQSDVRLTATAKSENDPTETFFDQY